MSILKKNRKNDKINKFFINGINISHVKEMKK